MEEPGEKKKKRARQKKLCEQIRKQMEFYFSDSNLSKDRFLKRLMDESTDKWIELDVFSKFNKLRNLTTDIALVAKALQKSDLIEVNEAKTHVRRTRPVRDLGDVDSRTIYVECLPHTATHDWVRSIFSEYGIVAYVSLPKYKSTGDIKGFAFVEYEEEEAAMKACQALSQQSDASTRPGKFPINSSKQMKTLTKQALAHNIELPSADPFCHQRMEEAGGPPGGDIGGDQKDTKEQDVDHQDTKKSRKRPRTSSVGTDDGSRDVSGEKRKRGEQQKDEEAVQGRSQSPEKSRMKKRKQEEGEKGGLDGENDAETAASPKKKRKEEGQSEHRAEDKKESGKKNRKKKKKKTKIPSKDIPPLKVISKHEWLALRKEYLDLQKANMKQLKQSLKQAAQQKAQANKEADGEARDSGGGGGPLKSKTTLEFTPDVIVVVTSDEPLKRKPLKESLSEHGEVAYIDLLDGEQKAHVRCPTAHHAAGICQVSGDQFKCALLQGKDEKQYWDKILADRERKLGDKSRKKRRGKDKMLEQVEQVSSDANRKRHIVFEDP